MLLCTFAMNPSTLKIANPEYKLVQLLITDTKIQSLTKLLWKSLYDPRAVMHPSAIAYEKKI